MTKEQIDEFKQLCMQSDDVVFSWSIKGENEQEFWVHPKYILSLISTLERYETALKTLAQTEPVARAALEDRS